MEVEIISKTSISPSSPTLPHLKTYKISLLDQFLPSGYIPTILFYPNSQETNTATTTTTATKRSLLLKQSLSETLSRFYPLAGKLKDNLSIDCNDEGVPYTKAKSNISLSQLLAQPDIKSLNKLCPDVNCGSEIPPGSPVALIQETTFGCGGLAISMYVSHMVCDVHSMFLFLKDWAATTATAAAATTAATSSKSRSPAKHPFLDGESIFPQYTSFTKEDNYLDSLFAPFIKRGKCTTKRILFTESAIAKLKAKAVRSNNINNPTRVEVVTTILSKSLMSSFKNRTGMDKPLAIIHIVNLRQKLEQPLPECSLGNFTRMVGAVLTTKKRDFSDPEVSEVREAIRNADCNYLKEIRNGEDGFFKHCDEMKKIEDLFTSDGGEKEFALFSSWCNFGAYDIDFGCGKPIWVAIFVPHEDGDPYVNIIAMMDTRTRKGVEAWVSITEDDFNFLEKDTALLQYGLVDQSPLLHI